MAAADSGSRRPPHHREDGGFHRTWPLDRRPGEDGSFARWRRERRQNPPPPSPPQDAFPTAQPSILRPRAPAEDLSLTWIGHATFLVQLGGVNLLTDPHFSDRASPVQWAGPRRLSRLPVGISDLPPIDLVVLSHDHYDHLDSGSVRKLARHSPEAEWVVPLAYERWLRRRGVRRITEVDWWKAAVVAGVECTAVPVQHWTRRGFQPNERLWSGWTLTAHEAGRSVFFAGDSGYFHGFRDIRALGPFDASLIPIGAYEPRWFMRHSHMNPEEAVQVYKDVGGHGLFAGMHFGTFRLTDEDPLEPPIRTRAAWAEAGLDPELLWVPIHGESRIVTRQSP